MEVRRIKGDARMGELLRRALAGRRQPLEEDVSLRVRFARATVSRERVNDLVASIVARPAPYKSGRLALRSRLVSEARAAFRSSGRLGADEAWFEGELTSSEEFGALLDTLWPTVSPTTLVRDLLSSRGQLERYASGLFSPNEWPSLLRTRATTVASTAWSVDDLALLDEAAFLIGGRSRAYGHIVVDEAQDLTPMQFRMIARRSPSGSITVLGDLAQATGPWTYANWDEVRAHLPEAAPPASRRADARLPRTGPRVGLCLPAAARRRPRRPATSSIRGRSHRPHHPAGARGRTGGPCLGRGRCADRGPRVGGGHRPRGPGARGHPARAATHRGRGARTRRHDAAGHDRPGPAPPRVWSSMRWSWSNRPPSRAPITGGSGCSTSP